ncbi:5605_t:CDS:2, partial [Scutellospora calospora]
ETIIELSDLDEYLIQIFDLYEHNKENQENNTSLKLEFSCTISISTLDGNSEEQADKIIEIISNIDDYIWIYHNKYISKKSNSITYNYYCSQRDCLIEKSKKNNDFTKHRDRQQMERFSCKGYIKIIIFQDHPLSNIEMHHCLHSVRLDNSISSEIKQFILENIDLLPREIYKRLVAQNLSINIYQKQIHFWWMELGKKRFQRDNDSLLSAQKWLRENSHQIIFQKEAPQAIGFLTGMWDIFKSLKFQINEIGVDATFHAQINGSGYPLAYLFLENNGNCSNGIHLVIYIIMTQVVAQQQKKFYQISSGIEKELWRKSFKQEWKKLKSSTIHNDNTYLTSLSNWVCGCPYFATSRFFICKHLVQQKGIVDAQFFDQ